MFSVIFEVHPRPEQWDAYLGIAKALRPELERIDGFVDNIRYRSLTREGWLLSLSNWRDEKSVVRWRTQARHHAAQEKGRSAVFSDYHLRVGQVTKDTRLPEGHVLREQRLDETEAGEGTTVMLIDAQRPAEWVKDTSAAGCRLRARPRAVRHPACSPGTYSTPCSRRATSSCCSPGATTSPPRRSSVPSPCPNGARLRRVRVVRDYGMFDRREAPQYYPDAPNGTTRHA